MCEGWAQVPLWLQMQPFLRVHQQRAGGVDRELLGRASPWVGANFDLGALRSFRELLSQPVYFNESFLQFELLGQIWHRPMRHDHAPLPRRHATLS